MRPLLSAVVLLIPLVASANPFETHGKLQVSKSGTYLEHKDGTPFLVLADTCWTGPTLSTEKDWQIYLDDRKAKGFTAVQFNCVCPWRTAPTDASGRASYEIKDGKLIPDSAFFDQLEARVKAINNAGMLAMPVLVWAHKKGDAGFDLSEEQIVELVNYELGRLIKYHCLFIFAGDARYNQTDAEKWRKVGRAVFEKYPGLLVTTHPTGTNFPWKGWENEKWLNVLGYQSGHGDDANTWKWLHSGPPAEYGKHKEFTRPVINLEPPYENHNGYTSKKPHSDYSARRAIWWSLLVDPPAGVTYGGHGVWSWHAKPGEEPTDHKGTGVAKTWKEALNLPGAGQIKHVATLFESIPWTQLRPTQEFHQQEKGKDDPAMFIAGAKTTDNSTYVFYFPAGATGRTKLHIRGGPRHGIQWFDPRTGKWSERPTGGLYDKPDDQDWVMVVKP